MRESSARLPAHQAGAGAGASSAEDGGGALQCSSWSAPSSPHRAIWEATHTIFTRHTGEGVEGRPRPGLAAEAAAAAVRRYRGNRHLDPGGVGGGGKTVDRHATICRRPETWRWSL